MCQTGYLPDHPRRRRPLKFCMRGRVREVVICFKFYENRSRGLGVWGRKSPSPIDLAHGLYNSLYYRTSRDSMIALTNTVPNPEFVWGTI